MEPDHGVMRPRETCKAGEATTVTAVKSNRALPESLGDQGHTNENEEKAEQLAQRKPRKRRRHDVCSQAAFLSKATDPGDRICKMQCMIMSGLSMEHPTGTDLQEQEDMSGNKWRQPRQGMLASSLARDGCFNHTHGHSLFRVVKLLKI